MKSESVRYYLVILIAVLLGAGLAVGASQGGFTTGGLPVFALGILVAFAIQWLAFIPAYILKTEKFYDLTGSISYLTVMALALILVPTRDFRAWLVAGLVSIWALRLGVFLFLRISKSGEDRRFREIKGSFARFLQTWTIQGLWVSFTLSAALVVVTSQNRTAPGGFLAAGLLIWLIGFTIEVTADSQKNRFRENPANQGKFIQSGLWAWSRHPNYFGEIVIWTGMMVIALPVLGGWQWVSLISPIFVTLLLTRVSGIPLLEKRADEKWGGQTDYEIYKAKTPVLIPRPPKGE